MLAKVNSLYSELGAKVHDRRFRAQGNFNDGMIFLEKHLEELGEEPSVCLKSIVKLDYSRYLSSI